MYITTTSILATIVLEIEIYSSSPGLMMSIVATGMYPSSMEQNLAYMDNTTSRNNVHVRCKNF